MRTLFRSFALLMLLAGLLTSCAHAPKAPGQLRSKITPSRLLMQACSPGADLKSAKGVAWMRARSRDASGTFPANIDAEAAAGLKLEVTHPFGGTLAILTIQNDEYRIIVPGKPRQSREGRSAWSGIPLEWATDLFLGRIPCPNRSQRKSSRVLINDENELVVDVPAGGAGSANARVSTLPQKFIYTFDEIRGRYWPKTLYWGSGTASVNFKFDDPENQTWSPLKWEARSKQGEVKIHWRDREVTR